MKIGYHDKIGFPSGLTTFVRVAIEKGLKLCEIGEFPSTPGEGLPDIFIINPIYSAPENYWSDMKKCVTSHPNSRILIISPCDFDKRIAEERLGNQKNIEYITSADADIEKLINLLN